MNGSSPGGQQQQHIAQGTTAAGGASGSSSTSVSHIDPTTTSTTTVDSTALRLPLLPGSSSSSASTSTDMLRPTSLFGAANQPSASVTSTSSALASPPAFNPYVAHGSQALLAATHLASVAAHQGTTAGLVHGFQTRAGQPGVTHPLASGTTPYPLYSPAALNRHLYLDYLNTLPTRIRYLLPSSPSPRLPPNMPPPMHPPHATGTGATGVTSATGGVERSHSESETLLRWHQHQKQQQAAAAAAFAAAAASGAAVATSMPSTSSGAAAAANKLFGRASTSGGVPLMADTSRRPRTPPVAITPSTSTTHTTSSGGIQPVDTHASSSTTSTTASTSATTPTGGLVSASASGSGTQPYYPSHFMRGTIIQLASGDLKRVEDLSTEDFIRSANLSHDLKMDSSTVVRVEEKTKDIVLLGFSVGTRKVQVSVEATVEHPFFVIGQGWSSYNPERTRSLYGLPCQRLQVGDICISLTHRDAGGSNSSSNIVVTTTTTTSTIATTTATTTTIATSASTSKPPPSSLMKLELISPPSTNSVTTPSVDRKPTTTTTTTATTATSSSISSRPTSVPVTTTSTSSSTAATSSQQHSRSTQQTTTSTRKRSSTPVVDETDESKTPRRARSAS